MLNCPHNKFHQLSLQTFEAIQPGDGFVAARKQSDQNPFDKQNPFRLDIVVVDECCFAFASDVCHDGFALAGASQANGVF